MTTTPTENWSKNDLDAMLKRLRTLEDRIRGLQDRVCAVRDTFAAALVMAPHSEVRHEEPQHELTATD